MTESPLEADTTVFLSLWVQELGRVQPITCQTAIDMFRQQSQAQRRLSPLFVPSSTTVFSFYTPHPGRVILRRAVCLPVYLSHYRGFWFFLVSEAMTCSPGFVETTRLPLSALNRAMAHLRHLEDFRASKWSG